MNGVQVTKNENKPNKIFSKAKKKIRHQSAITQKNTKYLDFIATKSIHNYQKLHEPKNKNKRNKNLNMQKISKNNYNKISEKSTNLKTQTIKTIKYFNYYNFKINPMKLYFITRKIIIKHYFSNFINLLNSYKKNNYINSSSIHELKNNIHLEKLKLNFDAKKIIGDIPEQYNTKTIKSIQKIYTPRCQKSIYDSFNNVISNKTYCFPDNTMRVIKGLDKRDKLLRLEDNYRSIKKNILFSSYDLLKYILENKTIKNTFNNYSTFNIKGNKFSNEVVDMINKINLSSEKYTQNDMIQEENEVFCKTIISKEWVHLPIILIKYVVSQILKKNGKKFIGELKKISELKLKEIQKQKLIYCYKLINIKILKYYFRVYRDNIIIARVQNLIFSNNYKNYINLNESHKSILRNIIKEKKKRNKISLEKRAELFLTKNTKLNTYYKKFIIFTSKIRKTFEINTKKEFLYLLKLNYRKCLLVHNLNTLSAEKYKKSKKYIRVKYSSKSIHSLSKKTSASESKGSGEIITPYIKKMKIQKRIIPMMLNFKEIEDDISDGEDNKFYLNKIKNIIINWETKNKMKYFKKWKKIKED